jgi:hypothetical protein
MDHRPAGVSWETFLTSGESTIYGDSVDLGPIRTACCTPDPKAEPTIDARCSGPAA